MPIQTACSHCGASYNLPDEKNGKTVRCKKCQETFTVGGDAKSNGAAKKSKDSASDKVQAKAPQRKVNGKGKDDDKEKDNDKDDDKGKGKKKKGKPQGGSKTLVMAGVGGGAALLIIGAVAYYLLSGGDTTPPPVTEAPAKKDKKKKDEQVADAGGKGDPKNKGGKGDPKGGKGDPKGGKGDPKGGKVDPPKEEEPKDTPPDLPKDDPIFVNYERLRKDRQVYPAEVKAAAEFFGKTDPVFERDVNGLFNGFKSHPWRRKVARQLELLIDAEDFLRTKIYWDAYCSWVTPEDFNQLVLHMSRAGEHRAILMVRIAEFRDNPRAMELIVHSITSPEQNLAIYLMQDLGGRLCTEYLFPYIWHPQYEIDRIALSLVQGFDLDIDQPLYKGPVDQIPRLPAPKMVDLEGLTLDHAELILSKPLPKEWNSLERFQRLATLGWLQEQRLSKDHWDKISKGLDGMILAKDYPISTNTLICLERWVTGGNLGTLKKCYDDVVGGNKIRAANLMKRIPTEQAQLMLITMWPDMEPSLQLSMVDYMLSVPSDAAKAALVRYFNHKIPVIQKTARKGALEHWNVPQETLLQQCMSDSGNVDSRVHALAWLKTQPPPLDEKKKKEYLAQLEPMAKPAGPGQKITPEEAMAKAEAANVLGAWGNNQDTPDGWVKMLEDPKYNIPSFKTQRERAMDKLSANRYPRGVSAIALRYKYPEEKALVVTCLGKIGPAICDPNLLEAFESINDKEKKKELLKVMGLVCDSRAVYDALEARYNQTQPALDEDLRREISVTLKNLAVRVKS